MNKIKLTVALFSAFSLMIFSSFNIEPLNSDLLRNVINPDSLEGTYRMIAFNTGIPTDLNNGSFTATSKGVDVNASQHWNVIQIQILWVLGCLM